jgi:hypothetical protein
MKEKQRGKEVSRMSKLRREDRAMRDRSRKSDEKVREKRINLSKKFETKTKGRVVSIDKEMGFEFEIHQEPKVEMVYTRPVVHVDMKKTNETDSV